MLCIDEVGYLSYDSRYADLLFEVVTPQGDVLCNEAVPAVTGQKRVAPRRIAYCRPTARRSILIQMSAQATRRKANERPQLRVYMLGGFRLEREGASLDERCTRAVRALLAFLLLNRGRVHTRQELAALFWPDYHAPQGQKCLSTALWRARLVVEPEGVTRGAYLHSDALGRVGIEDGESLWTDTAELESVVSRHLTKPSDALHAAQAEELERALGAYRGDLLSGLDEEWAVHERERLKLLFLKGLQHLVGFHQARGQHELALVFALRILEHDSLREDVHRQVMSSYGQLGQRGLVAQQYRACCNALRDELGLEPSAETRVLYSRLSRSHSGVLDLRPGLRNRARTHAKLCTELRSALVKLDELRRNVEAALELVGDPEAPDVDTDAPAKLSCVADD